MKLISQLSSNLVANSRFKISVPPTPSKNIYAKAWQCPCAECALNRYRRFKRRSLTALLIVTLASLLCVLWMEVMG